MLTSVANKRMIPGYQNVVKYTDSWLTQIVAAADFAVKQYTKRWLELRSYTEYYDGSEQPDLVCRQWPVLCGTTQVAAGSNGQLLPGSGGPTTINVVSTTGFDPSGRSGTSPNDLPAVCFQTSPSSFASVTYTGVTATSFTGCSPTEPYNGAGTLSSGQGLSAVWQPAVWVDPNGYGGQAQPGTQPFSGFTGPYGDGTLQVQGANYMVYLDGQDPNNGWNSVSKRGILRRIGGYGQGFSWYWPSQGFGGQGKLAAYRRPCWPGGTPGNTKVTYSAGYATVPADLQQAVNDFAVLLMRFAPLGDAVSSQNLGGYSYSILKGNPDPEMATIRQVLSRYREISW